MRAVLLLLAATSLVVVASAQNPVVWSSYLGGRFNEAPNAIAVGGDGSVYVVGATQSPDFPTTPGALRTLPPKTDVRDTGRLQRVLPDQYIGFLARLDATGKRLLYGTYVGGSVSDSVNAVAVSPSGNVYLAGGSESPDMPTTANAPQKRHRGNSDGFLLRLNSEGKLAFSTFLGGSDSDLISAVAHGSGDIVYVAGSTASTDFAPTPSSLGAVDGFVVKIDACSGKVIWTVRLARQGSTTPTGLSVHPDGTVLVAGMVQTPESVLQPQGRDAFLAKINGQGELVDFASFGGSQDESVVGPAIDPDGSVYLAGQTKSTDLRTTPGAYRTSYQGGSSDAYAVKVASDGRETYVTYLGGDLYEGVRGIAVDPQGRAHLIGDVAGGAKLPTTAGAPAAPQNTGQHIFYAVLEPLGKHLSFLSQHGGVSREPRPFRITRDASIALGPSGDAYVLAMTTDDIAASRDAYQSKSAGGHELVIFRLSSDGIPQPAP